ncbi:putative NADH-cytochrome b5 reductase [Trypanosoma conorhini]|uniref:Putative NADH-cytochrome b5 reductase n=1 Tax=Trypanosoma conorhini TaxID=83891 RepID=A0A422NWU9_9TRYP|nr:putative NADH-cytochrome b5 reductase [Trypanosoma conorhini]RNF09931.1 putative NADH-cytochrome b5 reductase [Trypanosoma conorhini]
MPTLLISRGLGKVWSFRTKNIYTNVGLVIGGTGIAPAHQIIRSLFADASSSTSFVLLCCNKTEQDVLSKDSLDQLVHDNSRKFCVSHLPSEAPANSSGHKGIISRDVIRESMPTRDKDGKHMLIVSGSSGFMNAVCGMKEVRSQGALLGYLEDLGFTADMLHKF